MTIPQRYFVDGVETDECPVSAITPRSFELVQLFATADKAREKTGNVMDLNASPGWLYDAAVILRNQEIEVEIARDKAIDRHR